MPDAEVPESLRIRRILLVLEPEALQVEDPAQLAVYRRAVELARATGSALDLYAPIDDASTGERFFRSDPTITADQQKRLDLQATRLEDLAFRAEQDHGLDVTFSARWERADHRAILRRANAIGADLVVKNAGSSRFILGLLTNTDWELIRSSPIPVWFAHEPYRGPCRKVLTAIGCSEDDDRIICDADYRLGHCAQDLAAKLGADARILHVYQPPQDFGSYAAYTPDLTLPPPSVQHAVREEAQRVAEAHGRALRAFAQALGLDPENQLVLRSGNLSTVLPEVAEESGTDLIIMGARHLSRPERLFRNVHAEPVLALAPCDVLVVPLVGDEDTPILAGRPQIDLEEAVVNPERYFRSPRDLASYPGLSVALRRRLLKIWESDILAEMQEEYEGGPTGQPQADRLAEIHDALRSLEQNRPEP